MSATTTAGVYGTGTPSDLSRLNAIAPRHSHGLRSESAVDGWYAAPRTPRKTRVRRNGIVTSNKPDPRHVREMAVLEAAMRRDRDEDMTTLHYGYAREHNVSVIRMGDMD